MSLALLKSLSMMLEVVERCAMGLMFSQNRCFVRAICINICIKDVAKIYGRREYEMTFNIF
jgi:hypothetical protein